jgi:hypothetical protein
MADIYVATTGNDTTGDGSVGNPYATPGKASGVASGGDTIFVKAGTYTFTSNTINVSGGRVSLPAGSATAPTRIVGYDTNANATNTDTKPVLEGSASTTSALLTQSGNFCEFYNLHVNGKGFCSLFSDVGSWSRVMRCRFSQSSSAAGVAIGGAGQMLFCELDTKTANGGFFLSLSGLAFGCVIRDATGTGTIAVNIGSTGKLINCIVDTTTNNVSGESAIYCNGSNFSIINCTIYASSLHAIRVVSGWGSIINTVITDSGGYGVIASSSQKFTRLINVAGYNNSSGLVDANFPTTEGSVSITSGTPFMDAPGGNFSPNAIAERGLLLRSAGVIGTFPGGTSTGAMDIGAVQSLPAGGGCPLIGPGGLVY